MSAKTFKRMRQGLRVLGVDPQHRIWMKRTHKWTAYENGKQVPMESHTYFLNEKCGRALYKQAKRQGMQFLQTGKAHGQG